MYKPIIAILVLAAGLLTFLYWRQGQHFPAVVSGFVEADEIRVGSRVGGRVAEVAAEEGHRVTTGQLLLRIDPFDLRERLAQAESQFASSRAELERLKAGNRPEEIAQAQARRDLAAANLEKLTNGPRPQEIESARAKLKSVEADFEFADGEAKRVTRLRAESSAATTEFDQAVRNQRTTQAAITAAQQELSLLEQGTRKEDLDVAKASLAEADEALHLLKAGARIEDVNKAAAQAASAEAQVSAIRTQLAELNVLSPCDCVVEAVDLRPGDIIAANAPTLALLDTSRLWVRTYVPESLLGAVRLTQQVDVNIDGVPSAIKGRITFLATEAEFTPRNIQTPEERSKQVFRIKVVLESPPQSTRVGMSADVHFGK
ncbi:MAG: efflux RND transporter periplasmic adaptor subunit [Planctomycetes bacterium]|nr:efflux RND transporter periplasmic adaptor subunit [Planctomycetota bacterium]